MRAFLIGASPAAKPAHTLQILKRLEANPARDLLIAVDGGVRAWRRAGIKPHMAVGDWDSLGDDPLRELRGLRLLTLPAEKDDSDFYLAACAVLNAGATELYCLGVTGGRPDHHLATILDLARLAKGRAGELERVTAYGPEGEYHFLGGRKIRRWVGRLPRKGTTVSVFALGGPARGVTLKGFKYSLRAATLQPSSRGLSNLTQARRCEVNVRQGALVVVLPA